MSCTDKSVPQSMASKPRQKDKAVDGAILYPNIMCLEIWVTGVCNSYRSHSLP